MPVPFLLVCGAGVKLIGLMICRNSDWCLRASLMRALRWCDAVVVLDHASADGTPAILDWAEKQYPFRIHRLEEHGRDWFEMAARQRTLDKARDEGATHCAIVDDDEILSANWLSPIRSWIDGLAPGEVLQIPWITCWRSLDKYRCDDHALGRAMVSVAFADTLGLHWKRRAEDGYEHHHRHPYGSTHKKIGEHKDGGVLHLQHVSWRRLLAKQAWYQATEVLRWGEVKALYSNTVNEAGLETCDVPPEWWGDGAERTFLDVDADPWQESEVRRLVNEHGRERFTAAGADLFGVA